MVTEYLKALEFSRCFQIQERWRTVLYKHDSSWTSWGNLLTRWQIFLDLLANLADPGETAALREIRLMCPGKDATLEEVKEACHEKQFHTTYWRGITPDTDILERVLCPGVVYLIFDWYLQYGRCHARRPEQNTWMLNDLPIGSSLQPPLE